jgi:hypothetical protein
MLSNPDGPTDEIAPEVWSRVNRSVRAGKSTPYKTEASTLGDKQMAKANAREGRQQRYGFMAGLGFVLFGG